MLESFEIVGVEGFVDLKRNLPLTNSQTSQVAVAFKGEYPQVHAFLSLSKLEDGTKILFWQMTEQTEYYIAAIQIKSAPFVLISSLSDELAVKRHGSV